MRIRSYVGASVGAISLLPVASAWGAAGHEIVATIAQIHLNPGILTTLCSILNPDSVTDDASSATVPCHLATVASWADTVRRQRGYGWSGTLHYINALDDHPSETCIFPGERGWAGREGHNVLGAIRNVTGLLEEFVEENSVRQEGKDGDVEAFQSVEAAQEALKFLIHFVGDMHQPLHLSGRDKGGNGAKVHWDNRVTNLHSLWDNLLIAKALRNIPYSSNYSYPLPIPGLEAHLRGAIYDPYIRKIMWEGIGVGAYSDVPGRWDDEVEEWLDCPAPATKRDLTVDREQTASGVAMEWIQSLSGYVWPAWLLGELRTPKERKEVELDWDDEMLCPYAWAKPLHELNCDLIWPPELDQPPYSESARSYSRFSTLTGDTGHGCGHGALSAEDEIVQWQAFLDGAGASNEEGSSWMDAMAPRHIYLELDTPKYAGRIEKGWVVEKVLAMGGIRLAAILNDVFRPLTEDLGRE